MDDPQEELNEDGVSSEQMPSMEDFIALLNKVFDISSSAVDDSSDDGGESIPSQAKLKRMKSLKMADITKDKTGKTLRKGSLGGLPSEISKFGDEEEIELPPPETLLAAETKLVAIFGEGMAEIFNFEESRSPRGDDKKKGSLRGRGIIRMPGTLRSKQEQRSMLTQSASPSSNSALVTPVMLSISTSNPITLPPLTTLTLAPSCKSTIEERTTARAKISKALNLTEKELIEVLRVPLDPPSPKTITTKEQRKSGLASTSTKPVTRHRRATSAGNKEDIERKTVSKKKAEEIEVGTSGGGDFDSACCDFLNLNKFNMAFGRHAVIEVIKVVNDVVLSEARSGDEQISPGRSKEKKRNSKDETANQGLSPSVKEKLGLFLLHRPTQQDLKVGGILPDDVEASAESPSPTNTPTTTTTPLAASGSMTPNPAKKRSIFGRQDSKNSIFGPSSPMPTIRPPGETSGSGLVVSTNLNNKTIRDKINRDYLGKKLPEDYPTIKPAHITDPDSFEFNSENPPLLLPVFGFRLEVGTSMPQETKEYLAKVDNLFLQDTDRDVRYYRDFFVTKEHVNYLGFDPKLGAVAVSIELPGKDKEEMCKAIIRTKRGTERALIPGIVGAKGLLKAVMVEKPMLNTTKFVRVKDPGIVQDLLEFEEKMIVKRYKFGVLYVKDGQDEENDMFANVDGSEAWEEFLDFLGERITLKGWKGYRGGLDVSKNSTGTHSVYTKFRGYDVMFHVSTLLPWSADDIQQLERKRHLGNDIVVLVFVDGKTPFPPDIIKSEFNHCFIVVQVHSREPKPPKPEKQPTQEETPAPTTTTTTTKTKESVSPRPSPSASPSPSPVASSVLLSPEDASNAQSSPTTPRTPKTPRKEWKTYYKISCGDKAGVSIYGPVLPDPPIFKKGKKFREYFLTKIVNAERAALHSPDFKGKIQRTHLLLLKDIVEKYVKKKDLSDMNYG